MAYGFQNRCLPDELVPKAGRQENDLNINILWSILKKKIGERYVRR